MQSLHQNRKEGEVGSRSLGMAHDLRLGEKNIVEKNPNNAGRKISTPSVMDRGTSCTRRELQDRGPGFRRHNAFELGVTSEGVFVWGIICSRPPGRLS